MLRHSIKQRLHFKESNPQNRIGTKVAKYSNAGITAFTYYSHKKEHKMSEVTQVIQNPKLWAGLNKPGIPVEEADIVMFGIPFDGSTSFRSGTRNAPKELRNITYTISPNWRFQILWRFEKSGISAILTWMIGIQLKRQSLNLFQQGRFLVWIGGDHSTTIPVHRGIDKAIKGSLGIIHIDAHFDLCDDMDGNRFAHGCTEKAGAWAKLRRWCWESLFSWDPVDWVWWAGILQLKPDQVFLQADL